MQKVKVLQAMSWATTKLLSKFGSPDKASEATRQNIEKLKAILGLFELGNNGVPQKELEDTLVTPLQHITVRKIGKRHLSKQARQALKKEEEKDCVVNAFGAETIIQGAIVQCLGKDAANLYIDKTIQTTLQEILPAPKPVTPIDESLDQFHICRLNKKAKPLKASWKNSARRRSGDDSEEDETTTEETKVRWKGKHVVKARRISATRR